MFINNINQNNVSFGMFNILKHVSKKRDDYSSNPNKLGFDLDNLASINKSSVFSKDISFDFACKNLENKMLDQTFTYDKYCINSMINSVSSKTGVSKETVKQVLGRLTQFASYSQLDAFSDGIKEASVSAPYFKNNLDFSLGSVLCYLSHRKEQFDYEFDYKDKTLLVDNLLLDKLEKGQDEELIKTIKSQKIPLALVDGWCASSNGKDVSYTLFGAQMSLEDSLLALVNKMKEENLTVDEALNKEAIDRIHKLFGDEVEIKIIKNKNIDKEITNELIANNLKPNLPDADEISTIADRVVDKTLEKYGFNKKETQKARSLLMNYFNSMVSCYSAQTITKELKQQFEKIEEFAHSKGKTLDDVFYIIPDTQKSFDLITYQYLKTNDVPLEKVIHYGKTKDENFNLKDYNEKIFVVLDDVVGSGASILNDSFKYYDFSEDCYEDEVDINLVFAPMMALTSGIRNIDEQMRLNQRSDKDIILTNNIIDYSKFEKTITEQEQGVLSKLLCGTGYSAGKACISLPYMIPDNCTVASGMLLSKTLNKNTAAANKASGNVYL